jgi:hypothetical protein
MVVMVVLVGLLLFGGYAGVTGRFAADTRDPEFTLSRVSSPADCRCRTSGLEGPHRCVPTIIV